MLHLLCVQGMYCRGMPSFKRQRTDHDVVTTADVTDVSIVGDRSIDSDDDFEEPKRKKRNPFWQ